MEEQAIYLLVMRIFGFIICSSGEDIKHHFYYEGYGEASLSCNGSDVIYITEVKLTNYPTPCINHTCKLTSDDVKIIEMCNKKSVCVIPIKEMSSCLKDKGFYNIHYSCQRIAMNCDFETSECGWNFSGNKWTITRDAGNRFIHVTIGNADREIESRQIAINNKQCLSFKYAVYNRADSLILYLKYKNRTTIKVTELKSEEYSWKTKELSITTTDEYRLLFVTNGKYWWSQYALDDIILENTSCDDVYADVEQIPHNKICNNVDMTLPLDGCNSDYLSLSSVSFDPSKENCKATLPEETTSFCSAFDHVTYCDVKHVVTQNPFCFNRNRLKIIYTCTGTFISNESNKTGMVVGVIIGSMLIIGLVCTVAWIIYRRRNCDQNRQTGREINVSASWHARGQGENLNSVQLDTKTVPPGNVLDKNLATNQPSEDEYAESVAGIYDISGNNRHKVKDSIYDHNVDDTYDTSNRGRHEDLGDYTYNHVFGKQTEDEYDIAGS